MAGRSARSAMKARPSPASRSPSPASHGSAGRSNGGPDPHNPIADHGPDAAAGALQPDGLRFLQATAGNQAALALVQRQGVPQAEIKKTAPMSEVDEALRAGDLDRLKAIESFPKLSTTQMLGICNLINTQGWVGPRDEYCLEAAWRSYGPAEARDDEDYKLWKQCEDKGAEIKNVPWMFELRSKFAEESRSFGYSNLEQNQKFLGEEAKSLGIQLPGEAAPAPTQVPETTHDQRLQQRQELVKQLLKMKGARKRLETLDVGYAAPPSQQGKEIKAPVTPIWARMKFDPENQPNQGPTGHEEPAMPTWKEVKGVHEQLGDHIGKMASTSPLAYALLAQEDLEDFGAAGSGDLGKKAEEALKTSLEGVKKTRANLEPPNPALGFEHLKPVHERLYGGAGSPVWKGGFGQALARDYVAEEKGDEGQLSAILGVGALILIVASIATGGAALAAFGTIMGVAGSVAAVGGSVPKAAAMQSAANAQVNKDTGLVDSAEVSAATTSAIIDVAFALLDLYGIGKAVKGAASAAILAGYRGARVGGEQLARLATLSAAERVSVVGSAIEREGVASVVSRTGKSADELLSIVGKESAAGKRIAEYIGVVAKGGLGAAAGDVMPKLAKLGELSAQEADSVVRGSIDLLGPARTLELSGGWVALEKKVGAQAPVMERLRGYRDGIKDDVGAFLAERRAGSGASGAATDNASKTGALGSGPEAAKADLEAARTFAAARTGVAADRVEDVLKLGLGTEAQMEKFMLSAVAKGRLIGASKAVERRAILTGMINDRLRESGVPEVIYSMEQRSGGGFKWESWSVRFDEGRMTAPALTETDVREMLLEAYHEARHAEQFFMAARAQAGGEGRSVAWLRSEMGLPDKVATAAHGNPLRSSDAGYGRAVEWYQSVWGSGREWRSAVLKGRRATEAELRAAERQAQDALDAMGALPQTPAHRAARQAELDKARHSFAEVERLEPEFEEWTRRYMDLPEEKEAFGVEDILKGKIEAHQKAQRDLREALAKAGPDTPRTP